MQKPKLKHSHADFYMKKYFAFLLVFSIATVSKAQDSTTSNTIPPPPPIKKWSTLNLNRRSNDHLMFQIGYDGWSQMPDTANTGGFPRSFSGYFLFDFPFKTNPHFSIAIGAGLSSSSIYFKETYIDIAGKETNTFKFQDVSDTLHFKKYKVMTTFLEAPIELRYLFNPENSNRSWKIALGVKVGTILAAGTKGKNLLNSANSSVNNYIEKEKSKKFFNSTRMVATARFGYGSFTLFGTYQLNNFIKEGFGPNVRPYSFGLALSGL
jgi:hypothetical protein